MLIEENTKRLVSILKECSGKINYNKQERCNENNQHREIPYKSAPCQGRI